MKTQAKFARQPRAITDDLLENVVDQGIDNSHWCCMDVELPAAERIFFVRKKYGIAVQTDPLGNLECRLPRTWSGQQVRKFVEELFGKGPFASETDNAPPVLPPAIAVVVDIAT